MPRRSASLVIGLAVAFACRLLLAAPAWPGWLEAPPKLSAPPKDAVMVRTVAELERELGRARSKGTILLADGEYAITSTLILGTPGLVLRSASGDPSKVVIDGAKCRGGEAMHIYADDVTVAEITIRNVKFNGIKLEPEQGGDRFTAHGCVFHNVWQRAIKCPLVPADKTEHNPRDGRIQHCLFWNDRPKQFADDETDTPKTYNGNYVGGIDMKTIAGWTISDNVFHGIQGRTREGRACIYLADKVDRCIVERNVAIDCDVGIALGNPSLAGDWKIHCTNCEVRNNMITRCPETGLLAVYTKDCKIVHNTVFEPKSRLGRLIWAHLENEDLLIAGNLLVGAAARVQGKGKFEQGENLAAEELAELLVDPDAGDLHLKRTTSRFVRSDQEPFAAKDFDGEERKGLTIGADAK